MGPGSLFTSIIPNLLVPGVVDAIRASKGSTLFVCSLADMQGRPKSHRARARGGAHGPRHARAAGLRAGAYPVSLRPDSPATACSPP
ncbi:MAG: 2-phospho-L-lactate transferase CofD family protein [Eggerthellaceae bacterium]